MSYTTTHRFRVGDRVPSWITRVSPVAFQPYLTFAQDCVVVGQYPAARVDLYPTVHCVFRPNFHAGALLDFDPPPNTVSRFYIRGPRGVCCFHEETAPGEPMSPDAFSIGYGGVAGLVIAP